MITNKLIVNIIFPFPLFAFFSFSSKPIYIYLRIVRQIYSSQTMFPSCFLLFFFFLYLLLRFVCQTRKKKSLFHIVDTIETIELTNRIEYIVCVDFSFILLSIYS
jgi:hypothetical protein